MTPITIKLSKWKNVLILFGSALFVVIGLSLLTDPESYVSSIHKNTTLMRFGGFASVLFFGACVIYGIAKLFDNKPGLIIDDVGITDNTNGTSIGLIRWEDIVSIKTEQVKRTKFILVFVRNEKDYIENAKGLKRSALRANARFYGTPLSITSLSLQCSFNELENILNTNFEQYKQS